jgi:hypothetical protein
VDDIALAKLDGRFTENFVKPLRIHRSILFEI